MNTKLFDFQWHITNKCNRRCLHCYHDSYGGRELCLDELKNVFRNFVSIAQSKKLPIWLSITGGEPFLRPDFLDFLKYLNDHRKLIKRCSILTNGSLLTPKLLGKIKNDFPVISNIQISIEGDIKINDEIRGDGSFYQIFKAVTILKKLKINTNLTATISKKNHKNIFNIIDYLLKFDIPLHVQRIVPIGAGDKKSLLLDSKEYLNFSNKIHKINLKYKKRIIRADLNCTNSIQSAGYLEDNFYKCSLCEDGTTVCVLPNGDVLPCRLIPIKIGNTKKEPLELIYNKKMKEFTNYNKIDKDCRICPVYSRCLGGARCMSLSYVGDYYAKDPHCMKK